MTEQIILAGDMALNFGLAIGSTTEGYLDSCSMSVEKLRQQTCVGTAANHVRDMVIDWAIERVHCVDLMVFEELTPQNMGPGALTQYAMLTGFLQAGEALYAGNRTKSYYPSTVKARGAGNGRAKKSDMVRAANLWSGYAPADDNEADAMLLLKIALEDLEQKKPQPVPPEELPF